MLRRPKNKLELTTPEGIDPKLAARLAEMAVGRVDDNWLPELDNKNDEPFISSLLLLASKLGILPDAKIIYPGSATHTGVAEAFGIGNVVHVDPDEKSCKALGNAGYNAVCDTVEGYTPEEKVDAIIALNSYGAPTSEIIDRLLLPNGVVIVNNYTHWAHEIACLPGMKLEAAILPRYSSGLLVNSQDIPEGSTQLRVYYYNFTREGTLTAGTPDDHSFAEEAADYPDALFAFRYLPGRVDS